MKWKKNPHIINTCVCVAVHVCVCVCVCVHRNGTDRGQRELRSNRYTVTTWMISALRIGSDMTFMRHFNVSLIVWAKSQDSVHISQFLRERWAAARSQTCVLPLKYYLTSLTTRPSKLTHNAKMKLWPLIVIVRW